MADRGTWSRQPRLRRRTTRPVWVGPGPDQALDLDLADIIVEVPEPELDGGGPAPAVDQGAYRTIAPNALGCGTWTYDIVDSVTGAVVVTDLDGVLSARITSPLDTMGDGEIVVGTTCTTSFADADGNPRLRTWRHHLRAARDGAVWFDGPITGIRYGRDAVTITCNDVLAYLAKRIVRTYRDYTAEGDGPIDSGALARTVIAEALSPHNPAGIEVVATGDSGVGIETKLEVGTPALDVLENLASLGVDFVAVGRRIYVGAEVLAQPIAHLIEDDFLVDAEVSEVGWGAATAATFVGQAVTASDGGVDPYFGLLEVGIKDTGIGSLSAATAAARRAVAYGANPPYTVTMPADAQLAPNAPIPFAYLVPGAIVGVAVLRHILLVTSMRITAVTVTNDGGNAEAVKVTLVPVGTIGPGV